MCRQRADGVRKAAQAAIATANADGGNLTLVAVGLKETRAYHLTHPSRVETISHILATMRIQKIDKGQATRTHEMIIKEPEDVANELEETIDFYREAYAD